jgi:hypothetical protein
VKEGLEIDKLGNGLSDEAKMEPAGVMEMLQACNSEELGSIAPVYRLP